MSELDNVEEFIFNVKRLENQQRFLVISFLHKGNRVFFKERQQALNLHVSSLREKFSNPNRAYRKLNYSEKIVLGEDEYIAYFRDSKYYFFNNIIKDPLEVKNRIISLEAGKRLRIENLKEILKKKPKKTNEEMETTNTAMVGNELFNLENEVKLTKKKKKQQKKSK